MDRLTLSTVPLILLAPLAAAQQPASRSAEDALLDRHAAALRAIVAGAPDAPRPKVVLLGTFHFDDPGLDAHKPRHAFPLFSTEGQVQLAEVLDRLAGYAPSKILVEQSSERQADTDRSYASYRQGKSQDVANEVVSVGFALAKRLGHERVYAIDAAPEWLPSAPDTEEAMRQEAERMGKVAFLDDPLLSLYERAWTVADEIQETLTLRQRLRLLNHPDLLRLSHGAYAFFAGFRISDGETFPGPDGFASAWHNRNLRMFANLQRLATAPDDRLLVIVGAGHVPILQQCVQCCPTMTWVSAHELLAPR